MVNMMHFNGIEKITKDSYHPVVSRIQLFCPDYVASSGKNMRKNEKGAIDGDCQFAFFLTHNVNHLCCCDWRLRGKSMAVPNRDHCASPRHANARRHLVRAGVLEAGDQRLLRNLLLTESIQLKVSGST